MASLGHCREGGLSEQHMLIPSFLELVFSPSNIFSLQLLPFANWNGSVREFSFVCGKLRKKKGTVSAFLMRLSLFNFKDCPLF